MALPALAFNAVFVFNIAPTFIEIAMVVGILFYNYGLGFAAITLFSVLIYVLYSIKATEWRTQYVREANLAIHRVTRAPSTVY